MIKNIGLILISIILLIQCGFTPIYSEKSNLIENDYETILTSENSIVVKEAFNTIFMIVFNNFFHYIFKYILLFLYNFI